MVYFITLVFWSAVNQLGSTWHCWLSQWQQATWHSHTQWQQTGGLKVIRLPTWWMSDQVAFLNYLVSILCCSLPGQCTGLLPRMSQRLQPPPPRETLPMGIKAESCTMCTTSLSGISGMAGPPITLSPSWLTAKGTITDYFPAALSTHRSVELDIHSVFFLLHSHACPCNLQWNLCSLSQCSCPSARTGHAQCGPWSGGQLETEQGRATSRPTLPRPRGSNKQQRKSLERAGLCKYRRESQADYKKLLAMSREERGPYIAGSGPIPTGQTPGSSGGR